MNEIFFLLQVLVVVGFSIFSLRFGQNALAAIVSINAVLANLFVVKQMELFGLTVTCSDVFAVGSIVGLNLMQEHFGKDAAKKAVHISFFCLIFFVFVSQVHLLYIPSLQDQTHHAFAQILECAPRIVFASLGVFYLVQKLDIIFFGYLKTFFSGKRLAVRVGISLFVSQFLDTVLFSFFALYGIVASLLDVILMSFTIKCLVIACSAPLLNIAKHFLKEDII